MPNAVQLTKNGQPVYPRTDVSLIVGLQDAIKLPPVKVATLPTASAETAGKMYYVGPDGNDEYERYITSIGDNDTYEWIDLGDTSIPLPQIADNLTTDDATQALSAKQGKVLDDKIKRLSSSEINLAQLWAKTENKVINADGSLSSNSAYDIYTVENDGYESVSGIASNYLNLPLIAFYNGTPGSGTLISLVPATVSRTDEEFNLPVPAGTTIIVVNGSHSASTPSMNGLLSIDLPGSVEQLNEDLASLDGRIDDVEFVSDYLAGNDLYGYKIDGYLNANGTWNPASTIKSVTNIPIKSGEVLRMDGITDLTGMTVIGRGLKKDGTTFDIKPSSTFVESLGDGSYLITMPDYDIDFVVATWLASLSNVSVYKVNAASAPTPTPTPTPTPSDPGMWDGLIWAGLGDSLTAQSSGYEGLSWSPMVEDATGLVFKNCGVGSTCLAGSANSAFWKRLSTVEGYDPDLVTILGGANDLYSDIPIGTDAEFSKTIANKDCNTFIGAYSYIIETLLTWKKTLRIVLLTTSYAHNDGADHTPGIGLTYKDYANATLRVAEYYGLPVVDLYRNMGLNKLTQDTTYTRGDNIHWNARASQIVASLVIAKLKEINNAIPTE